MTPTILVVDDDPTMSTLLRTLLELDGFSVTLVGRGAEVLATARATRPDAILMDVHIADIDGLDVLRRLRQDEELKGIPVVMTSGMDKEDLCLQAGANAFILKPYPPEQLSTLLKKVIS